MARPIFFVFIISLIFHSLLFSKDELIFNHLTVDDGLSQSSVTCIFQDSKGFMWFGTQDGLNRYDGYNFKTFKNSPSDSTSLNNNFIFSIYEDQDQILYIETQGGTLHRYYPETESFKVVVKDSIDLSLTRYSSVGALFYDQSGVKWTGGLGSGTGLKRFDPRTGETETYKHDPNNPNSLSNDKVYSVYRDHTGNLWVGTFDGLDRLDEKSGKFYHYRNDPKNPYSLPDNWVWPVFEDSKGNLWIGTVKSGLCLFDRDTKHFVSYKHNSNDPASISDDFIFSISGLIWVGTNLAGISYFNPSTRVFGHYKNEPNNANSLSDDVVLSMLADSDGNYWIGTRSGGLNKLDPETQKFSHYYHNPADKNSMLSNSIQTLLEDRSGILWIGSYSSGLDAFNPKTGQFKHFIQDQNNPESLSDNRIYALAEDNDDNIWVGTYGGGLNKIEQNTGKITHFQAKEKDASSLSSNATWSLAFDQNNNLWVGTFGGGLNVLDKNRKTFQHFKNNPADSSSINDDNIIRVFPDSRGHIWVGTTKGLSRYLPSTNSFKNYTEENGLANSFVYGIVEDDNGNLWLSTNNGLSQFNPEKETFRNYYARDGLQGNEYNQNAFAKDQKTGDLLFGGLNGFSVFKPDSIRHNTYIPPIVFTGYLRYNSDDQEGEPIIEKGISELDSIYLSYKDNIITLEFAALSYYNSPENQYKYKLEGFSDNWIQLGNNHSITFTNLSAGNYHLKVIGSNNDGLWNEEGASLYIRVSPPWWKTKFAYVMYFLFVFGFLYGTRRYELNRREQKAQIRESALRIKATEAEKRALEIENDRKTREFEDARKLQLSMLPKELPQLPDLEIAAFMRTATEVGGDYYDFMIQDDGALNIVFGDATGHGLKAGTMVTLMKGFFTSDASKLGFQEFLNHCSEVIKDIDLGRILMSLTYLKIKDKKLQITCAGMPPIYFYHSDNNEVEEIFIPGIPLGAIRNAEYKNEERELKSGDIIMLLTDGLPEFLNQEEEMFEYERVKALFGENTKCPPEKIIANLVEAGDQWLDGKYQEDDITFLVIKVK